MVELTALPQTLAGGKGLAAPPQEPHPRPIPGLTASNPKQIIDTAFALHLTVIPSLLQVTAMQSFIQMHFGGCSPQHHQLTPRTHYVSRQLVAWPL